MPNLVSEILKAFSSDAIIVVTDDDDREGESDLVIAATLCTTETISVIIRHISGIFCAPISTEDTRRLCPDSMLACNDSEYTASFAVWIDYRPALTNGISAEGRMSCCRALTNLNCSNLRLLGARAHPR
jgi:3,4-dihydroxy 2-butanone 4-phosphate synthase/GTP cyclohydrolase II